MMVHITKITLAQRMLAHQSTCDCQTQVDLKYSTERFGNTSCWLMFIDELKDVQFLWAWRFNNLMILGPCVWFK